MNGRIQRAGALGALIGCLASCAVRAEPTEEAASTDEGLSVHRDDLNGLWIDDTGTATISAWPAIGVRIEIDGTTRPLTSWKSYANGPTADDDVVTTTIDGTSVSLTRDVAPKPPITLALPGDRPFRAFLADLLAPAAQRDRESYTVLETSKVRAFVHDCEAFKKGAWQYRFMAGADRPAETASVEAILDAIDGVTTSPHGMIHAPAFSAAVKANVRASFLASYAVSELGLYLSTAAGRSVHIPLADDAMIYFVTDRPERAEKLGLSLTKTSEHGVMAASFGQQLSALGALPSSDDAVYVRAMMDLLTRSDAARVASLSPAGRSALADWYGTMAIEDYRVVTFGKSALKWGYNFTNAQFYGLVVRALGGQVVVGNELRPGDPSYADTLNSGKDMQEYDDMAALKQLATGWLLTAHPSAVNAVLDAFAGVVPWADVDPRAQYDLFHWICSQLYDDQGRTANLGPAAADAAGVAVGAVFDLLRTESADFEDYILAQGVTKSSVPSP